MPRHQSCRSSGRIAVAVLLGMTATAGLGQARADELAISGGGTLQGEVVPIEGRPGFVEVYTTSSAHPYVFRSDQVRTVATDDGPLDEYLRRRAAVEDSAEAHHRLGLWCEDHGLSGLALEHHRQAVERDEDHAGAQKKLGRVFFGDRWMTYDEKRSAQGLVQHEGRWITPEEKADLDEHLRLSQSQESWARRIDILVKKSAEGNAAERAESFGQLRGIADPEAVVPLVDRLGREGKELRLLLAEVLDGIDDPMAGAGLAHRIVRETDEQVRLATLNTLARRRDPEVIPRLIRELADKDPQHVGRAAWALAGLGAIEAVPKLIPELVSVQRRVETVLVPSDPTGGMGLSASFGNTGGPAFGIGGGPSIPVLTGPAVAPGAIAFGVQAVPLYQYTAPRPGFVVGTTAPQPGFAVGTGAPPPPVPRRVVRSYQHRNVEVLAALERLTGKNFGYDLDGWNRWLRAEFRSPAEEEHPERRVPQP